MQHIYERKDKHYESVLQLNINLKSILIKYNFNCVHSKENTTTVVKNRDVTRLSEIGRKRRQGQY